MKKHYIAPAAEQTEINLRDCAFTNVSVTGTGINYNSSDTGDPTTADSRKRHHTSSFGTSETKEGWPSFWDTEY